jgi:glycine oxidase
MRNVIVVGGGIIGLSCAWRLAQRGLSVTVFDAREMGAEASWAGAGMLAPGGEFTTDSPLTRMALASLSQYREFVTELTEATGISIDYRRCGALELALTEQETLDLNLRGTAQAALGIRSEATATGRFYPDDAIVNPRDVTAALKLACVREGVQLREHERVRVLGAGPVLIAAGAWSSELCPALPRVTPVRGHLISYDAAAIRLDSILRHHHTYLLQRNNGTIVAGTTTEHVGFDRTPDEAAVRDIDARARRLIPALPTPTEHWNGFRPAIEGDTPVIGRIPGTNIWAACGHYRNGILLAPETARIIASGPLGERISGSLPAIVDQLGDPLPSPQ